MQTFEINENPQNLENVALLHQEIFQSTPYSENIPDLIDQFNELIKNGDLILTVNSQEFDYPLAFTILKKENSTLMIEIAGVKQNFRKQGIWGYLYSFINHLAEKENYKYLGIKNIPSIFPEMNKFIRGNNFVEKEKENLGNGNFSITYIKEF